MSRSMILRTSMVLAFAMSSMAHAVSSYSGYVDSAAKSLYGSTASFPSSCNGCHGSGGFTISSSGTSFGKAFLSQALKAGYSNTGMTQTQVTSVISAIGSLDSDGDGANNQAELVAGTNPGDAASKPATTCNRANPQISLSPLTQTGSPGAALSYQLNVKNMDSSGCASSTFALSLSSATGLSVQLAMQSVVLSSGQSSSVNVSATSQAGLPDGALTFKVQALNSSAATYLASVSGTYQVLNPQPICTRAAPKLSLSPINQSAFAGGSLNYEMSVLNNDSAACLPSNLALVIKASLPLSATISVSSLSLSPGQSGKASIVVTSQGTAAAGSYPFSVQSSDAAVSVHSVSISENYVVKSPQDLTPPLAPSNVKSEPVRKQYLISWSVATDNIGVVKYRVYVDGNLNAETTDLSLKLRLRRGPHSITVTALDAAGNESPASSPIQVGQ